MIDHRFFAAVPSWQAPTLALNTLSLICLVATLVAIGLLLLLLRRLPARQENNKRVAAAAPEIVRKQTPNPSVNGYGTRIRREAAPGRDAKIIPFPRPQSTLNPTTGVKPDQESGTE